MEMEPGQADGVGDSSCHSGSLGARYDVSTLRPRKRGWCFGLRSETSRVGEPESIEKHEYVIPSQLKDDMVHLFDFQLKQRQLLNPVFTYFTPDGVQCTLSAHERFPEDSTEETRYRICYREVVRVVYAYGLCSLMFGIKQELGEQSDEDSLEVLDFDAVLSIQKALEKATLHCSSVDEVHQSIMSIPVSTWGEQRDRLRRYRDRRVMHVVS